MVDRDFANVVVEGAGYFYDIAGYLQEELENLRRNPMKYGHPPHQVQEAMLSEKSRRRIIVAANRSGKTEGAMREVLWCARGDHPYKNVRCVSNIWCGMPDYPSYLRFTKPAFDAWCPPSWIVGSFHESDKWVDIRRVDGGVCRISFLSYDMPRTKWQGAGVDGIWLDEECPEDIFNECMARIVTTRGWIMLTFTPVCLPAGTRVTTGRGQIPIEEVVPGDRVAARDRVVTVSAVHSNGVEPLVEVTTRRGYTLRCTPNHEWVAAPSGTNVHDGITRRAPVPSRSRKVRAQDLTDGDWLAFNRGHHKFWPDGIGADVGYFLGQMVGDGSWRPHREPGPMKLTTADQETIEFAKSFLSGHGVTPRVYPKTGDAVSVEWCSIPFAETVEGWGVDRRDKTAQKRVPEAVWRGSKDGVRGFLQGLFDADGTSDKKRARASLCTISEDLVRDVQRLLVRFNVFASLSIRNDSDPNHAPAHILEINGANARRFMYQVGFRLSRKQVREWAGKPNQPGRGWDRVVSVRPLLDAVPVYDLTVDDDEHIFAADGFVSGNSGVGWWYDRLWRPGLKGNGGWVCYQAPLATFDEANEAEFNVGVPLVPHLGREQIIDFAATYPDEDERLIRIFGEVRGRTGLVYKGFDPKVHVVPAFRLPAHYEIWAGLDPGFHGFAASFGAISPGGRMYVCEEYFSQQETTRTRFQALAEKVRGMRTQEDWGQRQPIVVFFVDTEDPQVVLELNTQAVAQAEEDSTAKNADGTPMFVVTLAFVSIDQGLKARKAGFLRTQQILQPVKERTRPLVVNRDKPEVGEPMMYFFDNLYSEWQEEDAFHRESRTIWEIERYSWKKPPKGSTVKPDDADDNTAGGAHMMAGKRYMVMSRLGPPEEPEPEKDTNPALSAVDRMVQEAFEEMDQRQLEELGIV